MKHSREDYDRIQDPAGLIPDDEPVFLIRGQDKHALAALDEYARVVWEDPKADPQIVPAVRRQQARILEWQKHIAVKSPDLPPS